MSKTRYKKENKKNNKTKVVVGAYLSRKKIKKSGLYNTYHELLSEKWIVKRYRFHSSYIISPQSVAVFIVFFRDSNMIAIDTVEFRCYVAIIIPLTLGKL